MDRDFLILKYFGGGLNINTMKNPTLIAILLFCCSFQLSASHFVGGEVYWKCIPGAGKYVFYMDYYRDCGPGTANIGTGPVNLKIYNSPLPNNGALSSIQMSFVIPEPGSPIGPNGGLALQPICNGCSSSSQPISCTTQDQGTLEKYSYRSQPITLSGKPPSGNVGEWLNGWVFAYEAQHTRSTDIVNISVTGSSLFKVIMYGDGRSSQDPCYDSSPQFMEEPTSIVCDEYDFHFNNHVVDLDYDSLSYSWADIVDRSSSNLIYLPQFNPWKVGFSRQFPTPNAAAHNLNKPATIDPKTGEVSMYVFLPQQVPSLGNQMYFTSTRVDAFGKDAQGATVKTASAFRDMPFKVFNCPNIAFTYLSPITNLPINVNAKNGQSTPIVNGRYFVYSDNKTISLGDSLVWDYLVTDTNISPCSQDLEQWITVEPKGLQFDSLFTNSNGSCELPPCATLSPPPVGLPIRRLRSKVVRTQFNWKADCAHLTSTRNPSEVVDSRMFQFVFKIYNDFCPVSIVNYNTLNVTIELPETARPPKVYCFNQSVNGISFSFESMHNDPIRNSKYLVYLGQRPISSSTNFSFLSTPIDTIDSYTGVGSISANQLAPGTEYAIRLKQRDSICGLIQLSNYSSIISKSQSDSVQFRLVYQDSILSIQNHFTGNLQWYRNGVAIQNATSKSIQITTTGSYELEVTIGACTYRSHPYAITTVGNTALKAAISELSVYPNPTTNQINIGGLSANELVKSIRVYNLKGELVTSTFNVNSIDLISFQNQLYLIRVETNKQVIIKKIMKQ